MLLIEKLMKEGKLNQVRLAEATKIPQPYLSFYLAGRRKPKKEHLMALSRFFRVSADRLFEDTGEHENA